MSLWIPRSSVQSSEILMKPSEKPLADILDIGHSLSSLLNTLSSDQSIHNSRRTIFRRDCTKNCSFACNKVHNHMREPMFGNSAIGPVESTMRLYTAYNTNSLSWYAAFTGVTTYAIVPRLSPLATGHAKCSRNISGTDVDLRLSKIFIAIETAIWLVR